MTSSINQTKSTLTDDADERPLVSAAKQQARRLLKLSKQGGLQVNALNEALAVVARLHGYPDWSTLSKVQWTISHPGKCTIEWLIASCYRDQQCCASSR